VSHIPRSSLRQQQGLTLIELMIAVTIGLILVLGLVQVFSAARTAYQLSQGVARSQESGRFALDFLTRDIRMAGHAGCVNDQSLLAADGAGKVTGGNIRTTFLTQAQRNTNTVTALPYPLRFDVSIQGYEANNTAATGTAANAVTITTVPTAGAATQWTPALPAEISGLTPIAGSDIIVLRYFAPEQTTVTALTPAAAPTVLTYPSESASTSSKVASGGSSGLYAIANCGSATVFQASAAPGTTQMSVVPAGSNLNQLGLGALAQDASGNNLETYSYAPNQTWLYRAETLVYYVASNSLTKVPALYRTRWTYPPGTKTVVQVTDEMVDGVESMQLLFGEDSADITSAATGLITKVNPASVLDEATASATSALHWRRVGTVQVGLLVRGTGDRAAVTQAVIAPRVLNVKMNTPADGNYRTTYETTIALRNRLFGN
jgi:type IV pilus assembly protein PilW